MNQIQTDESLSEVEIRRELKMFQATDQCFGGFNDLIMWYKNRSWLRKLIAYFFYFKLAYLNVLERCVFPASIYAVCVVYFTYGT